MPRKKSDGIDFEKSLHKLNQLVETIEKGQLSLEDSLKKFEEGVRLVRACRKALTNAQQKVSILTQEDGGNKLKPFESDED